MNTEKSELRKHEKPTQSSNLSATHLDIDHGCTAKRISCVYRKWQHFHAWARNLLCTPWMNASGGNMAKYQPKTGQACSGRPGVQRDNCPQCEGTGQRIDFAAIRSKGDTMTIKELWNKACDHDGIARNSKFVVFSADNPWAKRYNTAIGLAIRAATLNR